MNIYHKKRLEVDSLLSLFKSSYRSERIDSVCRLLAEKENMLNTLLNFFRLDSGKEQANAVPFRLKNVIEILQTEFEPRAEAKDLTLRITGCSDIILMGDRNRLVQIGNNLLSNAIKQNLIPAEVTAQQASRIYASEADVLNVALFGMTALEWRDAHPDLKGNIRDYAGVNELICLSNMESLNAVLINEGLSQRERLVKLNRIAIQQMRILEDTNRKLLK